MLRSTNSLIGRLCLVICNVAGMVDLVILPLWIGSMMQSRGLNAQQAGALVTAYILGVFTSSLFFAPKLSRLNSRLAASVGFAITGLSFFALTRVTGFGPMAVLHIVAGLAAGCGLSFTHGTIGRSANPHRLFAFGGLGVGVFGIIFYATMPVVLQAYGSSGLFFAVGLLVALAAAAAALAFPALDPVRPMTATARAGTPIVKALAFLGVACLATTQAMIFAYIERIGLAHGFAPTQVATMLIIGGFTNLTAPMIAALMDKRISHLGLAITVLPVHACFGALAVLSMAYLPYAFFAVLFVWMMIFGHNFMFSLIALLDPSGRTVASTPAMLMIGAAVGPILGGTLIETFGYPSLAIAAGLISLIGTLCFIGIWNERRRVVGIVLPHRRLVEPVA